YLGHPVEAKPALDHPFEKLLRAATIGSEVVVVEKKVVRAWIVAGQLGQNVLRGAVAVATAEHAGHRAEHAVKWASSGGLDRHHGAAKPPAQPATTDVQEAEIRKRQGVQVFHGGDCRICYHATVFQPGKTGDFLQGLEAVQRIHKAWEGSLALT